MKRVFVAGHQGMVGSAICEKLLHDPIIKLITRSKDELDLTSQVAVDTFFCKEAIDEVFVAAAKVGGIKANSSYPAEFIYNNLIIECNLIHSAHKAGIDKLLFMGSSCIYPKDASQPIVEESLLTGYLEPTNEPYAVAKIAGIKLCESYNRQYGRDYRCIMPTNLYGPNDNFDDQNSHVIPALLKRFHKAVQVGNNTVVVWGSGAQRREFLHVYDLANAAVHVMRLEKSTLAKTVTPMCSHLNVGFGTEYTIKDLALKIAEITGFKGRIQFDSRIPDGPSRKHIDTTKLKRLGWTPEIPLELGLRGTYEWYLKNLC